MDLTSSTLIPERKPYRLPDYITVKHFFFSFQMGYAPCHKFKGYFHSIALPKLRDFLWHTANKTVLRAVTFIVVMVIHML